MVLRDRRFSADWFYVAGESLPDGTMRQEILCQLILLGRRVSACLYYAAEESLQVGSTRQERLFWKVPVQAWIPSFFESNSAGTDRHRQNKCIIAYSIYTFVLVV